MSIKIQKLYKLATIVTATCTGVSTAYAATKCIAIDTTFSTACSATPSAYYNSTEWAATCTYNEKSVYVQGVAACSSTLGGLGTIATALTTSADGTYCWCRMISPAASKWVSISASTGFTTNTECLSNCAYRCADYMTLPGGGSSTALRAGIFDHLI